jgi:hypothetical protein
VARVVRVRRAVVVVVVRCILEDCGRWFGIGCIVLCL